MALLGYILPAIAATGVILAINVYFSANNCRISYFSPAPYTSNWYLPPQEAQKDTRRRWQTTADIVL